MTTRSMEPSYKARAIWPATLGGNNSSPGLIDQISPRCVRRERLVRGAVTAVPVLVGEGGIAVPAQDDAALSVERAFQFGEECREHDVPFVVRMNGGGGRIPLPSFGQDASSATAGAFFSKCLRHAAAVFASMIHAVFLASGTRANVVRRCARRIFGEIPIDSARSLGVKVFGVADMMCSFRVWGDSFNTHIIAHIAHVVNVRNVKSSHACRSIGYAYDCVRISLTMHILYTRNDCVRV